MSGIRRHFDLKFKRQVVEESFIPGVTQAELCRAYHLGENQLLSWRKAYRAGRLGGEATSAVLSARTRELERIVVRQQLEAEFLKRALAVQRQLQNGSSLLDSGGSLASNGRADS
jgi:transposase-like protein